MKSLTHLVKRNCKLFFKDKGMFFSACITPFIMLVLYSTFLANVYRDSFTSSLPDFFQIPENLIDATVGGQLVSSLLAVCSVTVAFCCNMLMIQDKVTGAKKDLTVAPVKSSTLALSYYLAAAFSTLLVCLTAAGACLLYLAKVGWYLTAADVVLILLDVFLLVMFGTALSSVVHFFLSTQGQMSAVGTIVSAGYGFICGGYMPIAQFGDGLQKVLSFFPGTYGTCLIRNHVLRGVFAEMKAVGFPADVVEGIRDSIDCNLYFFGTQVKISQMYLVFGCSIAALVGIYVLQNICLRKKSR